MKLLSDCSAIKFASSVFFPTAVVIEVWFLVFLFCFFILTS